MKIEKEHFEIIKQAINNYLLERPNTITDYENGNFPNAERVKNLQARFNADLLYNAGLNTFVCKELYSYMDDTHIATALRNICPKVVRRY